MSDQDIIQITQKQLEERIEKEIKKTLKNQKKKRELAYNDNIVQDFLDKSGLVKKEFAVQLMSWGVNYKQARCLRDIYYKKKDRRQIWKYIRENHRIDSKIR